jgi:hypothetical protein
MRRFYEGVNRQEKFQRMGMILDAIQRHVEYAEKRNSSVGKGKFTYTHSLLP